MIKDANAAILLLEKKRPKTNCQALNGIRTRDLCFGRGFESRLMTETSIQICFNFPVVLWMYSHLSSCLYQLFHNRQLQKPNSYHCWSPVQWYKSKEILMSQKMIQFSIDLVEAALKHRQFLQLVDEHPSLYAGPHVRNAIRRCVYSKFGKQFKF